MATKTANSIELNLDRLEVFLNECGYGQQLEYLSAIREGVEESDKYNDQSDRIEELEEEVGELKEKLEESLSWDDINTIRTTDSIEWRANNLMDQQVMEQLAEAYEKLSPAQIIERLKVY